MQIEIIDDEGKQMVLSELPRGTVFKWNKGRKSFMRYGNLDSIDETGRRYLGADADTPVVVLPSSAFVPRPRCEVPERKPKTVKFRDLSVGTWCHFCSGGKAYQKIEKDGFSSDRNSIDSAGNRISILNGADVIPLEQVGPLQLRVAEWITDN